jgi:hypothetical protein
MPEAGDKLVTEANSIGGNIPSSGYAGISADLGTSRIQSVFGHCEGEECPHKWVGDGEQSSNRRKGPLQRPIMNIGLN